MYNSRQSVDGEGRAVCGALDMRLHLVFLLILEREFLNVALRQRQTKCNFDQAVGVQARWDLLLHERLKFLVADGQNFVCARNRESKKTHADKPKNAQSPKTQNRHVQHTCAAAYFGKSA